MTLAHSTVFVHRGLPSYIRINLASATRPGSPGYEEAGYHLGLHLWRECPANCEYDEWDDELSSLSAILNDDEKLAQWLRITFPRVVASVPSRRMVRFMEGVRRGMVA